MAVAKPGRLGRGLSALLGEAEAGAATTAERGPGPREITITKLRPGAMQPRQVFRDEELDDLTNSVREKGILQPILVRPVGVGSDSYEIVAGERRWRAAQRAGLHTVPVLVRTLSDSEALELAIIENVQRADLNPIEEAAGYQNLVAQFQYTQEQLASVIGKSRSHIANTLRLLGLPERVRAFLLDGKLSAGHARTLITAEDPLALAELIVAKGYSVREAEAQARAAKGKKAPPKAKPVKDADTRELERSISETLGMSVSIDHKAESGAGAVTVRYKSLEDLDEICRRLALLD